MSDVPEIADGEWPVMEAVWAGGNPPPTAGEVVAAVLGGPAGRRWQPRTVKSLLARLVKKGAVAVAVDPAGRHRYRPAAARSACVRRESRSFLDRVFSGRPGQALVHFLEQTDLPAAEVDRLRRLLEAELAKAERPRKRSGR